MPRFSIVIPCFNAASTLAETLNSITAQVFTDWEALCVDDGSCDGTRELIEDYQNRDPRIQLLRNPGKGPSAARNFGALTAARGNILCFCDADDIWTPDKLGQLDHQFRLHDLDGIYAKVGFFRTAPGDGHRQSTVKPNPLTIRDMLSENPVCTLSNFSLRKSCFDAIGGFDPGFVHNEDLDLLVRLLGAGAVIRGMDTLQVWYRCSPDGLSSNLQEMERSRRAVVERARTFGVQSDAKAEAAYLRYLARRSLRLKSHRFQALALTLRGISHSPSGFFDPLHRGAGTAAASIAALALPQTLRSTLFS
ncbi:glycosyltransferase [uncultured Pelagimonas sp.]|uniref:glycosyltransferase family 2 protein n=1 Tax=uncultured Pelagimonas sp. TaxID=1618102 RepID=UPI00262514CB|nr:glycosyltransferase [uncultured Pelagimonas sp.]